jgi:predicted nucleic acid-binding protein
MPSVVISEVVFGLDRTGLREPRALTHKNWLLDLIERTVVVPTAGRRREGSRGEQRVGWIMDLFIGATVWVHGYDLVTRNLRDFERIAALLPSPDADSRLLVIQAD